MSVPTRRTGSGPADTGSADRLIAEGNRAEDAGRLDEARRLYEEALAVAPGYARAHINLGIALEALRDADGARRCYESALAGDPGNPFASYNLGKLLYSRGGVQEAEPHLRAALERKPDFTDARVVLSAVLDERGDAAGAAAELERAIAQRPDYPGALYNYALVLGKLARRADAESTLRKVLALDPAYPRARFELGTLLRAAGRTDEAEALLKAAVEESPDLPEAHLTHGLALNALQRLPEAEAALRRAVALDPELTEAYRILARILLNQLRVDEGLKVYEAGRAHDPEGYVRASELFALNYSDALTPEALFDLHKAFGEAMEKAYSPIVARFANSRDPERRLRVGYVSGDLSFHAVALFLIPLLERHDRSAIETFCYSLSEATDEITARIVERTDHWRSVGHLAHAEVADAIARDGIDILIDLSGHSGVPAFDIFVRRPAPVQAGWLGYLCTTGLTRIDYRISDPVADPPGASERYHTETLLRLPRVQWCYRPMVDVASSPAPACERNGHVTFVSCNHTAKLSRTVRRLWAQILQRVPGSRLLALGIAQGPARETVLRDFAEDGVDASRVTIEPRLPLEAYFRRLDAADIALDAMPYSGGTTTCDALWMGVPVVTAPRAWPMSRSAASILSTVGLREWSVSSPEDYADRAVAAAADVEMLRGLRATLRSRMRASPLMDEPRFARDMEDAYRRMWRTWCAAPEG